jgi:hypothetical protein
MRSIFIATVLFVQGITFAHAADVHFGATVGGEISPGVYGRINIGNTPPPIVYAQPVYGVRPVRPVAVTPVYMHVPPGHAKKWSKHCHKYNACGQPVYFVKSAEYELHDHHGKDHGDKKHKGRHKD